MSIAIIILIVCLAVYLIVVSKSLRDQSATQQRLKQGAIKAQSSLRKSVANKTLSDAMLELLKPYMGKKKLNRLNAKDFPIYTLSGRLEKCTMPLTHMVIIPSTGIMGVQRTGEVYAYMIDDIPVIVPLGIPLLLGQHYDTEVIWLEDEQCALLVAVNGRTLQQMYPAQTVEDLGTRKEKRNETFFSVMRLHETWLIFLCVGLAFCLAWTPERLFLSTLSIIAFLLGVVICLRRLLFYHHRPGEVRLVKGKIAFYPYLNIWRSDGQTDVAVGIIGNRIGCHINREWADILHRLHNQIHTYEIRRSDNLLLRVSNHTDSYSLRESEKRARHLDGSIILGATFFMGFAVFTTLPESFQAFTDVKPTVDYYRQRSNIKTLDETNLHQLNQLSAGDWVGVHLPLRCALDADKDFNCNRLYVADVSPISLAQPTVTKHERYLLQEASAEPWSPVRHAASFKQLFANKKTKLPSDIRKNQAQLAWISTPVFFKAFNYWCQDKLPNVPETENTAITYQNLLEALAQLSDAEHTTADELCQQFAQARKQFLFFREMRRGDEGKTQKLDDWQTLSKQRLANYAMISPQSFDVSTLHSSLIRAALAYKARQYQALYQSMVTQLSVIAQFDLPAQSALMRQLDWQFEHEKYQYFDKVLPKSDLGTIDYPRIEKGYPYLPIQVTREWAEQWAAALFYYQPDAEINTQAIIRVDKVKNNHLTAEQAFVDEKEIRQRLVKAILTVIRFASLIVFVGLFLKVLLNHLCARRFQASLT